MYKRLSLFLVALLAALYIELPALAQDSFRIGINYDKTLDQLIADGQYKWVSQDINSKLFHFSGAGIIEANLVLVHLNRTASTQEILDELKRLNLVPARIEHLLTFGISFPDEQLKYPVIALGSVSQIADGRQIVASLWKQDGERILRRGWPEVNWPSHARFLAIQK